MNINKKLFYFILVSACIISFAAGSIITSNSPVEDIASHIYSRAGAKRSAGSWGSIYVYTDDATSTYGTSSMLTAVLEFLPGKQLQPPHQHANEEFTFIIDGGGTWYLNGKESPIRKGDLMYAKPWEIHGISNTTSDTLKFLVVKWNNKGVEMPAEKKE